jgi:hypothetical protein
MVDVNYKVLARNLWKKLDHIGTSFLLLTLIILLASYPKQVTQTPETGVTSFSTADGDTNMVDTFTQDYKKKTLAARVVIGAHDPDTGNSDTDCNLQYYFVYRAGEFNTMPQEDCRINNSANSYNYTVSSMVGEFNVITGQFSTVIFTDSSDALLPVANLTNYRLNLPFYGTVMKLTINDAVSILNSELSSDWQSQVKKNFDGYIPSKGGSDGGFTFVGHQAEYIANSLASSINTFAITKTTTESNVEFLLRVSGYTFFVDIIFQIFMWINGTKECYEQPPWKEEEEDKAEKPARPTELGTRAA